MTAPHQLPPAAAAWAPWLSDLVPELTPAFVEVVTALDRLLGPLPPLPDPGASEPTGLGGLSRRGPYDRLLLSEWVLADEVPDEFLRRAASQEHLFHELERVAPRGGRRCLVLVDTGPRQLGGPRLVQLALLVVFARRAERAGAAFSWASLQRREWFGATGFHPFPGLRSLRTATAEDVPQSLADQGVGPVDEVFVLGGDDVATLAGGRPTIALSEPLDVGPDAVRVVVRRPGLAPVQRDLELPAPPLRTRWLRDPFRPPPTDRPNPPRRTTAGDHGPLRPFLRFSPDGNRVLAVDEAGVALAYRLPEGSDAPRPPVRVAPHLPGSSVVALGWSSGRLNVLFRSPSGEFDWRLPNGEPRGPLPALPVPAEPGELMTWRHGGQEFGWLLLPERGLLDWSAGSPLTVLAPECLAIARRDGRRFVWVATTLGHVERRRVPDAGTTVTEHASGDAVVDVVVGSGHGGAGHAIVVGAHRCWSSLGTDDTPFELPTGARVVGAPALWHSGRTRQEAVRAVLWLRDGVLSVRDVHPVAGPDRVLRVGVTAAAGGTTHYSAQVAWLEPPRTVVVADLAGKERFRWE